ncbi:MAG: sodium-translocating pyrophosphatase, partial [Candidatus Fonsibacter ubiquis]|nr:sodium-translocating pyrophosphatase [Candidatus Fonsibacter ubiquis]NCU56024.1 sodium-translocating pyrophosphatase [Candidatus Fonsibacter ubiquis]
MMLNPSLVLNLVILCGILSIIFAYITGVQILSASSGNARMKEIAGAIQIGARAYLNRQYKTISIVGVVVLIAVIFLFN